MLHKYVSIVPLMVQFNKKLHFKLLILLNVVCYEKENI